MFVRVGSHSIEFKENSDVILAQIYYKSAYFGVLKLEELMNSNLVEQLLSTI